MPNYEKQPKILGFKGESTLKNKEALAIVLREEVLKMRELLGPRMMTVSSAGPGADLVFLKVCVELRVPTIVILPFSKGRFSEGFDDPAEWMLAESLMSVALSVYVVPGGEEAVEVVSRHVLAWADTFLFARNEGLRGETGEMMEEARDLGVPGRVIDAGSLVAHWDVPADGSRAARHGFVDRKELLEFFDGRFVGG